MQGKNRNTNIRIIHKKEEERISELNASTVKVRQYCEFDKNIVRRRRTKSRSFHVQADFLQNPAPEYDHEVIH